MKTIIADVLYIADTTFRFRGREYISRRRRDGSIDVFTASGYWLGSADAKAKPLAQCSPDMPHDALVLAGWLVHYPHPDHS